MKELDENQVSLQRRHNKLPTGTWKMLSVTNNQGNASQNHEIPPHSCQDGDYLKTKDNKCWRRYEGTRRVAYHSFVVRWKSAATMEQNESESESESRSVVSDSLQPHGLYRPWNSLGQNTGVGSCSLLREIFPTQGSNPDLPHCRQILYKLSHQGSPRIWEWIVYPFFRGSSQPRSRTGVSCTVGRYFTSWATEGFFKN